MNDVAPVIVSVVMFTSVAFVISLYIYFRSRERQMLIEKDLSADQIKEFFKTKAKINPTIWLKLGIILVAVGVGVLIGNLLDAMFHEEYWIGFGVLVSIGAGFILSYLVSQKYEKELD